ncbi:unnamed protein product [Calypogeia fissa]
MAMSRIVCVLLVLAIVTEAARIDTFNNANCDDSPTNTFLVDGNTCQIFEDQSAVLISEVSSDTRVSIHNQQDCEQYSSVAQMYGRGCVVQGATKLRAVWIQG